MSVTWRDDATIWLDGDCPVEDAEPLLRLLQSNPDSVVDWRTCSHLHSAVIQVLVIAQARMDGLPGSPFLRDHIAPLLMQANADKRAFEPRPEMPM